MVGELFPPRPFTAAEVNLINEDLSPLTFATKLTLPVITLLSPGHFLTAYITPYSSGLWPQALPCCLEELPFFTPPIQNLLSFNPRWTPYLHMIPEQPTWACSCISLCWTLYSVWCLHFHLTFSCFIPFPCDSINSITAGNVLHSMCEVLT